MSTFIMLSELSVVNKRPASAIITESTHATGFIYIRERAAYSRKTMDVNLLLA